MDFLQIDFYLLLLLSNVLMLGAAALAILRFREQCRRLELFWSSPTGAAISDDKQKRMRQQLLNNMRLEGRVAELQQMIDRIANNEQWPADRQLPIDNAVRMAKNGATVEQLTQTCGLNVGEAQLMKKLHGKRRQVPEADGARGEQGR